MSSQLYTILKGMTKQEILRYSKEYCEHGHAYIAHASCLAKKLSIPERVGFLDIETSNLTAPFGVVLTWCIEDKDGGHYEDFINEQDFHATDGHYDRRIVTSCIEAMRKFDRLIVYWGKDKRFDIPFLRTRAVAMGVNFPLWQERIVNDLYDTVKMKFRLGRNSLAAACTEFGIESKETPMSPMMWKKASLNHDPEAISLILEHNREDVISTMKLWNLIHNFTSDPKSSI